MSKRVQFFVALGIAVFVGGTAIWTRNPGLYILTGLAVASVAGVVFYGRDPQ